MLTSGGGGQPLQARYWGSGFLPAQYQGVQFRSAGDPVLYVSNPDGHQRRPRGASCIDAMQELNRLPLGELGDPEIATQIENYELAFRMQTSVPELMDISKEPKEVLDLYGAKPGQAVASPTTACSPAGWPSAACASSSSATATGIITAACPTACRRKCKETDQGSAALVKDLKQRGLLDDTLVIWGGEFGRTAYSQGEIKQGQLRPRPSSALLHHLDGRRRHQARASSTARPTTSATTSSRDPVHVHDLHATMLHLLGVDHKKLTYRLEGRDYRLTDVARQRGEARCSPESARRACRLRPPGASVCR